MLFYPISYIQNGNELCKPVFTCEVGKNPYGVPKGVYYVLECYCYEKECDCRKVMINFSNGKKILATIGYGWENLKFYKEWADGDLGLAKDAKGPILELGGIQSQYSEYFLYLCKDLIKDPRVIKSFKNHYALFKSYVSSLKKSSYCICKSGKKAGDCCYS